MSRGALEFSGITRSSVTWLNDFVTRDHVLPVGVLLDASQFLPPDAVVVTVGAAGAAQGAVAVPVDALTGPIPNGTILNFGGAKFARLTAAAAAGAVSLTVAALPTALADNDTATYAGVRELSLPSGSVIGRTLAEKAADTPFGPVDQAGDDDEIWITVYDLTDLTKIAEVAVLRAGSHIFENMLPGWANHSEAVKDQLRAKYVCSRVAEG